MFVARSISVGLLILAGQSDDDDPLASAPSVPSAW
jgi:hypothetical protein